MCLWTSSSCFHGGQSRLSSWAGVLAGSGGARCYLSSMWGEPCPKLRAWGTHSMGDMLLEASRTLSCFILTRTRNQHRHIGSGSRETGRGPVSDYRCNWLGVMGLRSHRAEWGKEDSRPILLTPKPLGANLVPAVNTPALAGAQAT